MPGLAYGAALIGDGSEVLGCDTEISADHEWGPRVLLFLSEQDFRSDAARIITELDRKLPETFGGWPIRFPDQDRPSGIDPDRGIGASSDHGVEVHTIRGWARRQLGADVGDRAPTAAEWVAMSEQLLLTATAGAVFRDDRGELGALRQRLSRFPRDVQLFKMARTWALAAAEMPFVGRAGDVGDDIGSRLICGRLVELAMRLCFLIEGRYAPYSKWFGSAWSQLRSADAVGPHLAEALRQEHWREREAALGSAFVAIGRRQIEEAIPGAVPPELKGYASRPYTVVNADEMAASLKQAILEPWLRAAMSGRSSSTPGAP